METKFKQHDKVMCNGYPGSVLGYYSSGMVSVRLAAGETCVPECDVSHIATVADTATLLNPQSCNSDCNEESLGDHFNI